MAISSQNSPTNAWLSGVLEGEDYYLKVSITRELRGAAALCRIPLERLVGSHPIDLIINLIAKTTTWDKTKTQINTLEFLVRIYQGSRIIIGGLFKAFLIL